MKLSEAILRLRDELGEIHLQKHEADALFSMVNELETKIYDLVEAWENEHKYSKAQDANMGQMEIDENGRVNGLGI